MEALEDRFAPATINVTSNLATPNYVDHTVTPTQLAGQSNVTLIDAINASNNVPGTRNTIVLATGASYSLSAPPTETFANVTTTQPYWWYGPNALPAIDSNITIQGNGAVLNITGGAAARFCYVSNGISNTNTPAGRKNFWPIVARDGKIVKKTASVREIGG